MPRFRAILPTVAVTAALACGATVQAQHHGGRSSPATAPPPPQQEAPAPVPEPIVPVSSGLGSIQFATANYSVPGPATLASQLRSDDDRVRTSALAAVGTPSEYLQPGHVAVPHSIELSFAALGAANEDDALLTVELDEHMMTAVLVPEDGNWRRVATLTFATAFSDPSTTPARWLRLARSLAQHDRYRAVFRAGTGTQRSLAFEENEAQLLIADGRAVITISYQSASRECSSPSGSTAPQHAHTGPCTLTERWLQTDPADAAKTEAAKTDAAKSVELVTATGPVSAADSASEFMLNPQFATSHLRSFACQPFSFSETSQHYEPTGPSASCHLR